MKAAGIGMVKDVTDDALDHYAFLGSLPINNPESQARTVAPEAMGRTQYHQNLLHLLQDSVDWWF
jgi:hypothetical protein